MQGRHKGHKGSLWVLKTRDRSTILNNSLYPNADIKTIINDNTYFVCLFRKKVGHNTDKMEIMPLKTTKYEI